MSPARAMEALTYCYKEFKALQSKVIEVGLVKLYVDSVNRFCSSTIASKLLK